MSDRPDGGDRGFVVVDKRGREEEREPDAPRAPTGSGDEAQAPGAGQGRPGAERALPTPDFASLVISLGHSALYHLGLVADPETGQRGERNLPLARQTIDLVEMLQQKTRGNLTPEEARLLDDLLYDLRIRYVEAAR